MKKHQIVFAPGVYLCAKKQLRNCTLKYLNFLISTRLFDKVAFRGLSDLYERFLSGKCTNVSCDKNRSSEATHPSSCIE